MISLPTLDLMTHEIRQQICARCNWRKPVDRRGDAEVVRVCERECPIFVHRRSLVQVIRLADPMITSRQRVLALYLDRLESAESLPRLHRQILRKHRAALAEIVHRLADEW